MAAITGQYRSSPLTYSNLDVVDPLPTDANGNLMVNIAAGETITVGTMTVGTIDMIRAGTINRGTINAATVNASTINTGTINAATVDMIRAGTISNATVNVSTINSGTINAATINIGTVVGPGATGAAAVGFPILVAGADTGGSVYTLAVDTSGHLLTETDVNLATVNVVQAGTINASTVNAGTINSGTINAGTINAGTVKNDGRPARNVLSFATTVAFAGSAFGTLVGSAAIGAGTSLWVNDVSIVNHNGTVQAGVVFGSAINGAPVIAKGMFAAQGGIQKSFPLAVNAGLTNTDLNCWSDAAGTVTFNVTYFISA